MGGTIENPRGAYGQPPYVYSHGGNSTEPDIVIPAVANGITDNTGLIWSMIQTAPPHSTLRFAEPGIIRCEPIVITNPVRLIGAGGPFGTVLRPVLNTTSPILDFAIVPSGTNLFGLKYGAGIERIAIDLVNAPDATGMRVGPTTYWFQASQVVISGGYRSISHHGFNAYYDRCMLFDPSDCMVFVDDDGLESSFFRMNLARNTPGTTDAYLKVILASSGQKGDLRLTSLQCQSGGAAMMNNGIVITAPTLTNLPVFASRVTIDNVSNGGPGLTLTNIESVDWEGGWINSAGSPGGPCVRITGGGDIAFRGVKYRGGGSTPKTYDFVGGSTSGFISKNCYCPTGPVYYLPASGQPTDMMVDDWVPGAVDIVQVTNDPTALRAAAAKRWGHELLYGRAVIAQEPVRLVGGSGQPAFVNSWANTSGSVVYFWKDANGVVHLAGQMENGTTGVAFTLPTTYRPPFQEQFHTETGVTVADVYVGTDGVVTISMASYPASTISLSGISFLGYN